MHVVRRSAAGLLLLVGSLIVSGCTNDSSADPTAPETETAMPEPPEPGGFDQALFGTHVKSLALGTEPVPPRAGSVRLWDSGVSWRELEPAKGQFNWAAMDSAVSQAEGAGAQEIVWVHGSTPQWAAKDPTVPGLYGPGTSSPPVTADYLDTLRAIATRYRGRITAYQVWNEANISIFYQGSPKAMAKLTRRAKEVLDEADPDAVLVGASTTVRSAGPVKPWYGRYTDALAELGWPVDAMAVHLYPPAEEGADDRAGYIRMIRPWLAERGWTGPLWDTEVNYGERRDFADVEVIVPQRRAAAWVARTYIDSIELGIDRVHWYSWNDHILGIDQVDATTGAILPAGQAYLTIQEWLSGAQWRGCSGELVEPTGKRRALTQCELSLADGQDGLIVFTHGGSTTLPVPSGAVEICRLDGTCDDATTGSIEVDISPTLIRIQGTP